MDDIIKHRYYYYDDCDKKLDEIISSVVSFFAVIIHFLLQGTIMALRLALFWKCLYSFGKVPAQYPVSCQACFCHVAKNTKMGNFPFTYLCHQIRKPDLSRRFWKWATGQNMWFWSILLIFTCCQKHKLGSPIFLFMPLTSRNDYFKR